ncbi:uncharacterized protein LOC124429560 [Vespa crabro]|uniref:uncharacterized protein LOC124429560 n=1 Tax=Vespa crabro TaxID=7445 RepID=UPI001F013F94|nr:uncharacterized protein LOC124429560 [Vespa crabro]
MQIAFVDQYVGSVPITRREEEKGKKPGLLPIFYGRTTSRRDYNALWKTVLVLPPAVLIVSSMQNTLFLSTTILLLVGLFFLSFFSSTEAILLYPSGSVFQVESTIVIARHVRDLRDTYSTIENLLEEYGWGNGRECLLRSICELAEVPFLRREEDIVEETIHLILTPTEDLAISVNSTHRSVEESYREAERLGKSGVDCTLTYPNCIESPLKSFTEILFP